MPLLPIPSQKYRPIGIVVLDTLIFDGLPAGIPWFTVLYPRPEDVTYSYPSRGTVIQTFDASGFVDDFGAGVVDINVTGHTGWRGNDLFPGELMFINLRDFIVQRFHDMRRMKAEAGRPIDSVQMYWVDTLSHQVFKVYPMAFTGRKNKQRPLLYQYQLRMAGVELLAGPSLLNGVIPDLPF